VVCSPVYNSGFESQVIALINIEIEIERANHPELSPLSANGALTSAARGHSTDMAVNNFFSHTGSDGSSFWDRIIWAGYSPGSGAENIAAGYGSPEAVVAGWMGSDGHRANILGGYLEIGVGYAYCAGSTYGSYWTANFGSP
jgi:uncharacterized protein YkwD